jgi:CHAT domain-containing protein/tetratricopeptide (TPR) repeat protein
MTETLDVDLKTDPRKDCQVHGPVEWQAGRLTLGPDAGVRRVLDLGSQARLTLDLAFAPLSEEGQTSTTRFAFQVRDRGEFVVLLVRRRVSGKCVSEVRLVDQDTPLRGQKVTRTLRSFEWQGDFPAGPWTFRHHYGLLTVYCGGRRLAAGYADKAPGYYKENPLRQLPVNQKFYDFFGIDEPLEVSAWSLQQQGMSVACTKVSGKASPSYRTTLAPSFDQNARAIARQVGAEKTGEINDLRARIDHPIWADPEALPLLVLQWEHDYRRLMVGKCLGEHHPYYALALHGGALQHQWGFKNDIAEKLLEKAVAISEESLGQWHPDCIAAMSSLGRLYREMGKFDRAEPLLTKASKATAEVFGPQTARHAQTLQDSARLLQYTNRFAEAEALMGRAVEACKDAHPRERANAQVALSDLQVRLGEREKAAAVLKQALETLEKLAQEALKNTADIDHRQHWLVFVDLGAAKVRRSWGLLHDGQEEGARKLAREAFLPLVKFHGGQPSRPGRFGGWNSEMRNVLPNEFLTSHPAYGRVMISLADLFITLGDFVPARACVSLADKVSMDITSRRDSAVLYRTTARLYERFGNLELGYWTGHLSERQRMDGVIKSLQAGNDAEERERQAYIAWVQSPVSKDNMTGEEKRKMEAIARKLRKSRAVLPPGARKNNPVRKPDYALDWHKIAVRELEWSVGPDHPETVDVLLNQARWQWRTYGSENARATFHDSFGRATEFSNRVLPGLPEAQAYLYLEASRPALDLLLSCYRATNRDHAREAYEAIWRGKALATRQVMDRRQLLRAASGGPEVKRLAAELQTTRQRLASLSLSPPPAASADRRQEQLAELTRHKEDLERELAQRSESYRHAQDSERASIADMIRRLPAKSVVVDFVERSEWKPPQGAGPWGQSRCYDAFVVRPAAGEPGWSATWLSLGDADALDRLLDGWVARLRSGRRPERAQAEELRHRLWAPIEAALKDCKTVVLIPDGRLAQVPWAALPGRRADSYLVEDYALAQAPFGQYVAHLLTDPAPQGDGVLLVGGINYGPEGKWQPLPGTAAEVQQLEQLGAGSRTVRLGDTAATKARLLEVLPDRRYVHLATHGEFLDPGSEGDRSRFQVMDRASGGAVFDVTARNPLLLSMLVLAGANRPARTDTQGLPLDSDSFLTAEEVMGVDLTRTELVVLSACETGLGKVRGGEGVFSLQRAFHAGGSRAVMASLWQIPDRATQLLMRRFYENLWHRKLSKLEALREAQVWMLREVAKQPDLLRGLRRVPEEGQEPKDGRLPPYYWAAFVLSGDWR